MIDRSKEHPTCVEIGDMQPKHALKEKEKECTELSKMNKKESRKWISRKRKNMQLEEWIWEVDCTQ